MYKEKFRRKAGLSLLDPTLQLVTEDPAAGQQPPQLPTVDLGRARGTDGDGAADEDGQEYVDFLCRCLYSFASIRIITATLSHSTFHLQRFCLPIQIYHRTFWNSFLDFRIEKFP